MKFLNMCLKNQVGFEIEDSAGQLICAFLNTFILMYFNDMEFSYTLNIELVTNTSYWGQVKIHNKIIERLELRIELFEDFIVSNIDENKRIRIVSQRNNTILHELIHIRNRLQYDLKNKRNLSTEKELKNVLIESMIDEYLAEYESNKIFNSPEVYTDCMFIDELTDTLKVNGNIFIKTQDIIYKIAVLAACQHLNQKDNYDILNNECNEIRPINVYMFNIIGNCLWFYNCTKNLEATKRKLSPSLDRLLELIENKRLRT